MKGVSINTCLQPSIQKFEPHLSFDCLFLQTAEGGVATVIEQNMGGKRIVTEGSYDLNMLTSGTVALYRPVPSTIPCSVLCYALSDGQAVHTSALYTSALHTSALYTSAM